MRSTESALRTVANSRRGLLAASVARGKIEMLARLLAGVPIHNMHSIHNRLATIAEVISVPVHVAFLYISSNRLATIATPMCSYEASLTTAL